MASMLIAHGACVDSLNAERKTPLFLAVALARSKLVTLLLNSGASVTVTDCCDNTPLHFALVPSIAVALVTAGVDVNARNTNGMTALHVASALGFLDMVCCLRALGAKEMRNINGDKPHVLFDACKDEPSDGFYLPFFGADKAAADVGGLLLTQAMVARGTDTQVKMAAVENKTRVRLKRLSSKLSDKIKDSISDSK
jgi:ankyrin repeat protein